MKLPHLLTIIILILFSSAGAFAERIPKWCKDDKLMYSLDDLTVKGFFPCGELSAISLCDTTGHKVYGALKPRGIFKDCSIGPRISIFTTKDFSDGARENFIYNSPIQPAVQISPLNDSTNPYQEVLRAMDKLLESGELSKDLENKFKSLRKDIQDTVNLKR